MLEDICFDNLDKLYYEIFKDITFSMAMQYELVHRQKGKDFRRILFAKAEELIGIMQLTYNR